MCARRGRKTHQRRMYNLIIILTTFSPRNVCVNAHAHAHVQRCRCLRRHVRTLLHPMRLTYICYMSPSSPPPPHPFDNDDTRQRVRMLVVKQPPPQQQEQKQFRSHFGVVRAHALAYKGPNATTHKAQQHKRAAPPHAPVAKIALERIHSVYRNTNYAMLLVCFCCVWPACRCACDFPPSNA